MRVNLIRFSLTFSFFFALVAGLYGSDSSVEDNYTDLSTYWERPIKSVASANQKNNDNKGHTLLGEFFLLNECGNCHSPQYKSWKTSLHARATGVGLTGQLRPHQDPAFASSCYFCHSPLLLASERILEFNKETNAETYVKNTSFKPKLKNAGISCAVCHLRQGQIYGSYSRTKDRKKTQKNKDNFFVTEKDFFSDSLFCAACHQLDNGYSPGDKPIINTYNEWLESPYSKDSKNKKTCQDCHMPKREHSFLGIHDKKTVLKALTIKTNFNKKTRTATLQITNSGVGHYFPTYTTPLVIVRGFFKDKRGETIEDSTIIKYIGREVTPDLLTELSDTRIAPLDTFTFTYDKAPTTRLGSIILEVQVLPDNYYNIFFTSALKNKTYSVREDIALALENTKSSPYILYRKEFKVQGVE